MDDYICYCFKYTKEALEKDAQHHGKSTIMAAIIHESTSGNCNCKSHNPSGK